MKSFMGSLWNGIFQPGTTPALETATHIAFACLLVTVAAMFYSTGSLHFVALFLLSSGLWAAITWFIRELKEFKAQNPESLETSSNDASAAEPVSASSIAPGAASEAPVSHERKQKQD